MLERVMIISGETSGELYGSLLAKELLSRNHSLQIIGVGGERMIASGVVLVSTISSSFGLVEALKTYRKVKEIYKTVIDSIKSFRPQLIILIDYPDFNLRVARVAKKLGIKVLYYVSPQIWAWRYSRIKTIKNLVEKIALILPFEEDIYRNANIPHEFVGHPVMDEIRNFMLSKGICDIDALTFEEKLTEIRQSVKKEIGLTPYKPTICIMLGSRPNEIERLFPVMIDVIDDLNKHYPTHQLIIPIAPNLENNNIEKIIEKLLHKGCTVLRNKSLESLIVSDAAIVASGTSTLQAALLGVPMIVVYKLSPLTYFIGKRIVKVKNISLVNLILDYFGYNELKVKELIQDDANRINIVKELSQILDDLEYRNKIIKGLKIVREPFLNKMASARVAEIVFELLGNNA